MKFRSISLKHVLLTIFLICIFILLVWSLQTFKPNTAKSNPWKDVVTHKSHLDHSHFFKTEFTQPEQVTRTCLSCHAKAGNDFIKTAHWTWLSSEITANNKHGKPTKISTGKKNLINNYCISITGNWDNCTQCHAGYGWSNSSFDFKNKDKIDCLVCHDGSGSYSKTKSGLPGSNVNLLTVAKSVKSPSKENCGSCHFYGGGGLGVKHGDLDNSLVNASEDIDVHMGKLNFQCTQCHKTKHHLISGKLNTTYSNDANVTRVQCIDCHDQSPHENERINTHVNKIACETCHIPRYAKRVPTKMFWDWSKAGDSKRKENPHEYLKIKGEFKYNQNIIPEYFWFNLKMNRYFLGDKIDPNKDVLINKPIGNLYDKTAKIWPFKLHRAVQPYDKKNLYLLTPVTDGDGGYWHEFNWDKAFNLGSKLSNISYSGEYGFTKSVMYWPLSHMVAPSKEALQCVDCHNPNGKFKRLDWEKLGYQKDPMSGGGQQ